MEYELRPEKSPYEDGRKRYAVCVDGDIIGHIEQHKPTFERKTKGKMYANSRWMSKAWHWIWWRKGGRIEYRLFRRVRKEAIEQLLRHI
jgi:hypothetical protein